MAGAHDRLDRPQLARIGELAPQQFGVPAHDHQQIVEVMRDAAGQLAERLHLLHLRELLARAFERDLGLLALGDVEADAVHADDTACIVFHHLDAGLHMADLAVRTDDPPLAAEILAGLDRGLHLLAHPLAVVGMDRVADSRRNCRNFPGRAARRKSRRAGRTTRSRWSRGCAPSFRDWRGAAPRPDASSADRARSPRAGGGRSPPAMRGSRR